MDRATPKIWHLGVLFLLLLVSCPSPTNNKHPSDKKPPAEVSALTAVAGNQSVHLSWTPPSNADFKQVKIVQTPGGSSSVVLKGTNQIEFTGLTNDTEYSYLVRTVDKKGNTSTGVSAQATPYSDAPPFAPTDLAAIVGNAQVALTWTDSSDETGYAVDRSLNGTTWDELTTLAQGTLTHTDSGPLTAGETYYYRVRATNAYASATSPSVSVTMVLEVTLDASTATVNFGSTKTLVATIAPSGANNKSVTWSTDAAGVATVSAGGVVTPTGKGTAQITATTADGHKTAQCTITVPSYTVTYNGNSNTGGTAPTDSSTYLTTQSVTVLGNTGTLVRTGYAFSGWNTLDTGLGTTYAAADTFEMGTANVTLYAKWAPKYTVTYSANGGTGTVPSDSAYYDPGQTVTLLGTGTTFTKASTFFSGWNSQSDGLGTIYLLGTTLSMPPHDLTLYAFWSVYQNETNRTAEADYANIQSPPTLSVASAATTAFIYGQIYEVNKTDTLTPPISTIKAQLGYGPSGTHPMSSSWTWKDATYNTESGNNDEYKATLVAPAAGVYWYAFRFSLDSGASWTIGDLDGAGSNSGPAVNLETPPATTHFGVMTVTAP